MGTETDAKGHGGRGGAGVGRPHCPHLGQMKAVLPAGLSKGLSCDFRVRWQGSCCDLRTSVSPVTDSGKL